MPRSVSTPRRLRLAINGFGRIGRTALRSIFLENYDVEVVAVNTGNTEDPAAWAHLFRYDSLYGRFPFKIELCPPLKGRERGIFRIRDQKIAVFGEKDPRRLPWKSLAVDLVLECTGAFRDLSAAAHLKAGAKKVVISASSEDEKIPLFVLGVNEDLYRGETIVSNASCTTNCAAPLVKIIDENFGFQEAVLTTIHAYTSNQSLVDGSAGPDLRRSRAATANIIPTSSGAAASVIRAYPEAAGRFTGTAIRVPVLGGSYTDLTFKLNKKTTLNRVIEVLTEAAVSPRLAGRLKISSEPLVSSDILGNNASAIVDTLMTQIVSEDMLQLAAWYDNEWGYSCRLVELAIFIANHEGKSKNGNSKR